MRPERKCAEAAGPKIMGAFVESESLQHRSVTMSADMPFTKGAEEQTMGFLDDAVPQKLTAQLSQILPGVVDKLTPNGRLPS